MWTIAAALLAAQGEMPGLPAWMEGCWEKRSEEQWTEECWTAPRGGMMMGSSRSGTGAVLSDWETMQIVQEDTDDPAVDRLTFWGSPRGGNRTMFSWRPGDGPGLAFYNLSHDYPQRIRYWREGEDLLAEISLADGSRPRRWQYKRVTRK